MSKITITIGTHGTFGSELLKSAEMIVGEMPNVVAIPLLCDMSLEDYMGAVSDLLEGIKTPIISFVDLYGGTPSNVFTVLSKKYNNQVITGVNLPVLIDLFLRTNNDDEQEITTLVASCIETIKESVVHTNTKI